MAVFENKFRVGVTDIGKDRKIKNKAIIRILEDVAGMHSEKVHSGINDIERTKLSWIILNWKIKVLKRPIYNDEIVAKTWLREANKVCVYRDFEIYDDAGNLLIIGTSKWAFINIETKTLSMMPEEIVKTYEQENRSVFKQSKIEKLKEAEEYTHQVPYQIRRDEIDVNAHVHNLYYLNMAYEALPDEEYYQNERNNIEILYKKQIKFDEKIMCFYAKKQHENIIAIKSQNGKELHAIVKLY